MSPARNEYNLSGFARMAAMVMVVSLGLWGCARRPAEQSSSSDRVRTLEARCVKLEQDYRSVATARDKARKDLVAAEDESGRLQKDLADYQTVQRDRDEQRKQLKASQAERDQLQQTVAQRTSERNELQQQINERTSERDALSGRCDRFRKGLQDLLIQDDMPVILTPAAPTSQSAGGPAVGGQS
jgi:chromosome segregation ATPase